MIRKIVICFMLLLPCLSFADSDQANASYFDQDPMGWHWNNTPDEPEQQDDQNQPATTQTTISNDPMQHLKAVQHLLDEAKAEAVLNPTVENVKNYMAIQQYVMNQSTQFANTWQKTLAYYPEYNYSVNHPTEAATRQIYLSQINEQKVGAAKLLAQNNGLIFFYQGKSQETQAQAASIADFAKLYGFALIGVPVDGVAIEAIPDNRPDSGQSQRMGVSSFPALILVNPKSGQYIPLAYGYPTQDELLSDCLNVVTNYQGEGE